MTRAARLFISVLAASTVMVALSQAHAGRPRLVTSDAPVQVTCTFENTGYAGACVESTTRSAKETPAAACRPILECLNNAQCVKTYCRSTSVRQGWTLKSAE